MLGQERPAVHEGIATLCGVSEWAVWAPARAAGVRAEAGCAQGGRGCQQGATPPTQPPSLPPQPHFIQHKLQLHAP